MPPSRLAELRQVHGWSLRDLAEKSGVDFGSLGMYEKRQREPRVSTAMKLVRLFEGDLRYEDLAMSAPVRAALRLKAGAVKKQGIPHGHHESE